MAPDDGYAMSGVVEDRGSTFVAYYIPSKDLQEVKVQLQVLRTDPAYNMVSADHRMAAWRLRSTQRTLLDAQRRVVQRGHDDDGESHAGVRLSDVMERMDAFGLVVVARWWGGVMLGPVRFRHIESAARAAIQRHRDRAARAAEPDGAVQRLRQQISQRDRTIHALRKALAAQRGTQPPEAPARAPEAGSVAVLRNLLAARDRTIGVLRDMYRQGAHGQEEHAAEHQDAGPQAHDTPAPASATDSRGPGPAGD